MSENQLNVVKDVTLLVEHLNMSELILSGNKVSELSHYREIVIFYLPTLEKLDHEPIS